MGLVQPEWNLKTCTTAAVRVVPLPHTYTRRYHSGTLREEFQGLLCEPGKFQKENTTQLNPFMLQRRKLRPRDGQRLDGQRRSARELDPWQGSILTQGCSLGCDASEGA